jgi:hypothetical protein
VLTPPGTTLPVTLKLVSVPTLVIAGCAAVVTVPAVGVITRNVSPAIEADAEVGTSIVNALKNPVWIPVFGRSACIPSTKLFSGSFETYEDAIASAKSILNSEKLIAYLGTKPDGKYYAIDMYDVPVISQAFKYTRRKVYKTII